MTTLRELAEKAAKYTGNEDCENCDFYPGGMGPCDSCVADAIERVAKEFAEKALLREFYGLRDANDPADVHHRALLDVRARIAAAARGE